MSTVRTPRRRFLAGLLAVPFALGLAACGDDDTSSGSDTTGGGDTEGTATTAGGGSDTTEAASDEPVTLRLGYFPNVTHAPALVGVGEGIFEENLPANVTLETLTFNAGPEAIEAIFSDSLDISYIGPNPAINGYSESEGEAIRIIAGATSGGAALVVREGIDDVAQLAGTVIATPQLGNTQDVAARAYFAEQGLETDTSGGGDVSIRPQSNADTLTQLQAGDIDGAWVPEPWVTRLVNEGGGHVLVDEADLWEGGDFVTTHVIVRTAFLEEHPDVVEAFLAGHLAAIAAIADDPAAAQTTANDQIELITTSRLADETISGAFANLRFTADPIAASLQGSADDAEAVGLLEPVDLASPGIYDLEILNRLLEAAGESPVEGL